MKTVSNLNLAKSARNDEYYTRIEDIETELKYYRQYFAGKVIYCNCDDPTVSNFWRYFHQNFGAFGLRGLIATCYVPGGKSYAFEYAGGDDEDITSGVRVDLDSDGDFRSDACWRLLSRADIVVTNPPFSLMSEYLPLLIESGKKFVILGNLNHVTMRGIREYILAGKVWLGTHRGQMHMWFRVPDNHEIHNTDYRQDPDGSKWRRIGGICWFTNLDIPRRHEELDLTCVYSPELYPKYDDYNAIECGRTVDIPMDYFGVIGVPITYLAWHCHDQFDILGLVTPKLHGKSKYKRFLIQRRRFYSRATGRSDADRYAGHEFDLKSKLCT